LAVIGLSPNQTYIVLNPTLNATLNATLYQPPQEWYFTWLKEWAPILLGFVQFLAAIALAWLTYYLWSSTRAYSEQVKEQTRIMEKGLIQDVLVLRYHQLREEMDKLYAPLYFATLTVKNIEGNELGMFRIIQAQDRYNERNKNDSEFWDRIKPNTYLSRSKKLRQNLANHFLLYDELQNKRGNIDTRKNYEDNIREMTKEIQAEYTSLQKSVDDVEKELDVNKFLKKVEVFTITENGKEWHAVYEAMHKPWWRFWK